MKKLYRYEEMYWSKTIDAEREIYGTEVTLELREYKVLKETDKSYLITLYGITEKWMRKGAKKEFASKTKEEALNHFIRRKTAQHRILNNKLKFINQVLNTAEYVAQQEGWNT